MTRRQNPYNLQRLRSSRAGQGTTCRIGTRWGDTSPQPVRRRHIVQTDGGTRGSSSLAWLTLAAEFQNLSMSMLFIFTQRLFSLQTKRGPCENPAFGTASVYKIGTLVGWRRACASAVVPRQSFCTFVARRLRSKLKVLFRIALKLHSPAPVHPAHQ